METHDTRTRGCSGSAEDMDHGSNQEGTNPVWIPRFGNWQSWWAGDRGHKLKKAPVTVPEVIDQGASASKGGELWQSNREG